MLPHACFDIRYATANNFTGAPLPGYAIPGAWLVPAAADALVAADTALAPDGYALLVFDAYRPARASRAMATWARTHGRADLLRDGWVAARSSHATGRTLDVGLCDRATGSAVDMGTAFDAFVPASAHGGVTGPAAAARATLRRVLREAGFAPYGREWWHYTLRGAATDGVPGDVPYADEPGPPSP